ncbi:hypothetical protein [Microbacterium enclense]|uniref:hypothetical protein n=1 Tax=Microbacterium enclense TaxID=993073 RepID=UPI0034291B2F
MLIVTQPSIVLTAAEVDMLWRTAGLDELRKRHRSGDTHLYQLLLRMHQVRLQRPIDAVSGTGTRHDAASEERTHWTIQQLSQVTGRAERTIRNDIALGELTATKTGRSWIVTTENATTYIASRKATP